jgi:hypothetical protein
VALNYAICYIYGLSVVLVLALSGTFMGLENALADSVIATITVVSYDYTLCLSIW